MKQIKRPRLCSTRGEEGEGMEEEMKFDLLLAPQIHKEKGQGKDIKKCVQFGGEEVTTFHLVSSPFPLIYTPIWMEQNQFI